MGRPFLIDANAFKKIYDDLVEEVVGVGKSSLDLILESDYVLIDEGGRIRQEWRDCSCGNADEYFTVWMSQRLIEDKIKEVKFKKDAALQSALDNFGMPNNDRIYCFAAVSNGAYGVISNDIDLYNPKAKKWDSAKRNKLMMGGTACVVKYMRKQFKVEIFPIEQTTDHCPAP